MARWFWPTATAESTVIVRVGRVMHWLAYSAAAVGFLIVLFATLAWGGGEIGKILEFVVWMIGIAAVGRSLRYVLANE